MSKPLGPCGCGWCKRYGNSAASSNDRPAIRNGPYVLHIHGRCARCHDPLGDTAYMVREPVLLRVIHSLPFYDRRLVPVCPMCATFEELDRDNHRVDCRGCGRHLRVPVYKTSRLTSLNGSNQRWLHHCDDACYRVALRRDRRIKQPICVVCGVSFQTARKDAQFCSSACRQKAYRTRLAAEAGEPDAEAHPCPIKCAISPQLIR
jgi:hypothetical protein